VPLFAPRAATSTSAPIAVTAYGVEPEGSMRRIANKRSTWRRSRGVATLPPHMGQGGGKPALVAEDGRFGLLPHWAADASSPRHRGFAAAPLDAAPVGRMTACDQAADFRVSFDEHRLPATSSRSRPTGMR